MLGVRKEGFSEKWTEYEKSDLTIFPKFKVYCVCELFIFSFMWIALCNLDENKLAYLVGKFWAEGKLR